MVVTTKRRQEDGTFVKTVSLSNKDQPAAPRRTSRSGTGKAAKPCCGRPKKAVARPSMAKQAMTAAVAMARFVGDGMKTATPEEQVDRRAICDECPLNDNGRCNGCGCVVTLKIPMRLEQCPAGKWHAELHAVRPIADPICNLIMHVLPVAINDVWKWNLEQIARRQNLFNGKRVLAIAIEKQAQIKGKHVGTVSANDVLAFSESIGLTWTHTKVFENSQTLREVSTFPWLLQTVRSDNPNELTFSCHAKGVTHSMDSITVRWAERQYRACLDDWQTVRRTMERYSMAGAFRKFGQFSTPGNHRWHYSGTNYWFRHDDVFSRDWKKIDQKFFGTESWPGRLFKPEETACLFADEAGDVYKEAFWKTIERQTEVWEGARNET